MSETKTAWLGRVLGVAVVDAPLGAEALEARLAAAMKRVPAALAQEAGRKDELVALATAARGAVATAPPGTAAAAVAALEAALEPRARADTTAPDAPRRGGVNYAKARLAWDGATKLLEADLAALREAILDEFAGAPAFDEIADRVGLLKEAADAFKDDLSDT